MTELIKSFRESIPALRFIGKQYEGFGHWGDFWQNGWFETIEAAMGGTDRILAIWENGGGYIGVERRIEGRLVAYYIGMLTPSDTPVPDGFVAIDFADVDLGTCWLYGREKDVHRSTGLCAPQLAAEGMIPWQDGEGGVWSFENCLCPRYTTPDEQGNVILDYCYFIRKA